MKKIFIVGGAGFIGSHLTRKILTERDAFVTVYDNFSSGKEWHLADIDKHPLLKIVSADAKDLAILTQEMVGHDFIFHFAANPDIAKAVYQPSIDFWEGTYLLQNVLEAMRLNNIKRLIYPSGSGVYGDVGTQAVRESHAPMLPISTYGASKLACENLICSYCHMFEMHAIALRFANVVGPHQTHGVGYDFVRKLLENPKELLILGNGKQSKSYIHVNDVVNALLLFETKSWTGYDYYNVATEDYITVEEIANIVSEKLALKNVKYIFQGGERGWKGDVPIVRFNSQKIRDLGWSNLDSSYSALANSIDSIIDDVRKGLLQYDKL
jgi:UDP-glucose 4-epimerase